MTAQIGDRFRLNGREYTLVAASEPLGVHPRQFGITPAPVCTACWNGFWCAYEVTEGELLLTELYVHAADGHYPPIGGVLPQKEPGSEKSLLYMGHHLYRGLEARLPYTGKLLLGSGFLREFYVHGGHQRAWAYEELRGLSFERGALQRERDLSPMAARTREELRQNDREELLRVPSRRQLFAF